eukprot:s195_g3.t2
MQMLHTRVLSGGTVTSIPVEQIHDVRGLKQCLNQLHGFPPRFQQRIRLHGESLKDSVKLDSAMDLEIVLLSFVDVPQQQADDLAAAASQGRTAEVESMLQLPQDPDLPDSGGRTAFMRAAVKGHVDVVRLLMEAGAKTDVADHIDCAALMGASCQGYVEVVRLLLEAGTRDVPNNGGYTALMAASYQGHLEIVRLLVEAGSDKDATNDRGKTALMIASETGQVEIVRLLLAAGANKDLPDNSGRTALVKACCQNYVEVVQLLLKAGANKDYADNKNGYTALIASSHAGHTEIVRLLLDAGADKDHADTRFPSGHVEVVRLLLEAGTNKDVAENDGYTALMMASTRGHVDVVRLLLEASAIKDLADNSGYTALMMASQNEQKAKELRQIAIILEVFARDADWRRTEERTVSVDFHLPSHAQRSGEEIELQSSATPSLKSVQDARAGIESQDGTGHRKIGVSVSVRQMFAIGGPTSLTMRWTDDRRHSKEVWLLEMGPVVWNGAGGALFDMALVLLMLLQSLALCQFARAEHTFLTICLMATAWRLTIWNALTWIKLPKEIGTTVQQGFFTEA